MQKEQWSCLDHPNYGPRRCKSAREEELISRDTSIVDVVIDPDLAGLMRDHQKEGVKVSTWTPICRQLISVHVLVCHGSFGV